MELAKYKACICEGSAENAIMDILLDNALLIFTLPHVTEIIARRCFANCIREALSMYLSFSMERKYEGAAKVKLSDGGE